MGHSEFIRVKKLPLVDIFLPSINSIVEIDESQHFSDARKISLTNYPKNLNLGYSHKHWIELCEKIKAKDPNPIYRDEQRAWYDTIRDFLPLIKGYAPTIRIYKNAFQWCSLNPENSNDIKKFQKLLNLQDRKPEQYQKITTKYDYFIERVIITSHWDGKITDSLHLLRKISEKKSKCKYFITPGGFIKFPWPKLPQINNPKEPADAVLKRITETAEIFLRSELDTPLLNKLKEKMDYLSIGIDSDDFSQQGNSVELVALINLKDNKIHWTGKFYPTPQQINTLIRYTDLNSHFLNLDEEKVLVLGCHDLNAFNPRGRANSKGWKKSLNSTFSKMTQEFKPEIVLHHPHTSDSENIWRLAWITIEKENPSIEHYAGAGLYYNWDGRCRSTLERVTRYTKKGNVNEFLYDKNSGKLK